MVGSEICFNVEDTSESKPSPFRSICTMNSRWSYSINCWEPVERSYYVFGCHLSVLFLHSVYILMSGHIFSRAREE